MRSNKTTTDHGEISDAIAKVGENTKKESLTGGQSNKFYFNF